MLIYILKRLFLIIPTLFIIILLNFFIVQIAPGGPVEQAIMQLERSQGLLPTEQGAFLPQETYYQGARGLSPEMLEKIKAQYGFDQPIGQRFWIMLKSYAQFDLGQSFFKEQNVSELILEKMPVTISLGLLSTLIIYLLAIPFGIYKAYTHGMIFDRVSSLLFAIAYAVPPFIVAVVFIVFFAGGSFFQWFPLQGMVSEDFSELNFWEKIKDYLWHMVLPTLAIVLGGLASLTNLTKFAFLEELHKPYVTVAKSKGLSTSAVLYGQVFRNAILVVIAALPETIAGIIFVGNILIEIIFNLDGLGLLGFEAIVQRDYPVIFGTLFIFTLLILVLRLIGDILYHVIDPRLHYELRGNK